MIFRLVLGTVIFMMALGRTAHADSIPVSGEFQLTSGSLSFGWQNDEPTIRGSLAGPGFSLEDFEVDTSGIGTVRLPSGATVDPSFAAVGSGFPFGTLRVGTGVATLSAMPAFSVRLSVSGPAVPVVALNPDEFLARFPFEFVAVVLGTTPDGAAFRYELTGRGQGSHFMFKGDTNFSAFASGISFQAADPVPEPTTMLLVGTGIASVAMRRRSVRKRC